MLKTKKKGKRNWHPGEQVQTGGLQVGGRGENSRKKMGVKGPKN